VKKDSPEWHLHYLTPTLQVDRADLAISHYDEKTDRLYEIKLCPIISLSVTLLNKEEADKERGNHKIVGTLQINNVKDFAKLWDGIKLMLAENGLMFAGGLRFAELPESYVSESTSKKAEP